MEGSGVGVKVGVHGAWGMGTWRRAQVGGGEGWGCAWVGGVTLTRTRTLTLTLTLTLALALALARAATLRRAVAG